MPSKDITYCSSSAKCPKREWCGRAVIGFEHEEGTVSLADFFQHYSKELDYCPHFEDLRYEYR